MELRLPDQDPLIASIYRQDGGLVVHASPPRYALNGAWPSMDDITEVTLRSAVPDNPEAALDAAYEAADELVAAANELRADVRAAVEAYEERVARTVDRYDGTAAAASDA